MDKKKNLLKLFTEDVIYNYHIIKTNEPEGHLIYIIKSGSKLERSTLEFSPTLIAEELITNCMIKVDKFAPSVFWAEDIDSDNLKLKLNQKFSESYLFSEFVEYIKDDYRILEIKDSLLFKKNPEEYEAERKKEFDEHQTELLEDVIADIKKRKVKREKLLLEYNNDLIKLMKNWFQNIVEFENRDFDFTLELEKFIANFIDDQTWIKVDDKAFLCRAEIIELNQNQMEVYLTDNDNFYIATLRFDKTVFITENVRKLNSWDSPKIISDYDILIQLYDVPIDMGIGWLYMTESYKLNYVIDYLVPIFKEEKKIKEEEYIKKITEDENK